ncbi:VOC family protein [Petrachloros mirabilis]
MAKQIYVNLSVKDLKRSMDFFSALGFSFEPKFTNDNAAALIIGENMYAMLLVEEFFKRFTTKDICDTTKTKEVIVAISVDSRTEVDELVKKAKAAGGTIPREAEDHDFMYGHAFEDLDGHAWEPFWMKPQS